MTGGDYVIKKSHLHAGVALRDLPSGYLAFLVDTQAAGELNEELSVNLLEYLRNDPEASDKLERGRRVPMEVVVKGFSAYPVTITDPQ